MTVAACDSVEDKKGRFFLKGNEKLKEDDTKSALTFYTEALEIDPDFRDARYNRAMVNLQLNNTDAAIRDLTEVIAKNQEDIEAIFQRGLAYLDNGENYKSLADGQRLVGLDSANWQSHFLVGLSLESLNNHTTALEAFEKGLQLNPDNSDLLVNKATIYFYQKNFEEAEGLLVKAENINPKEANIYNLRSMIASENGKYEEAILFVNKAIQLQPRQPYYYNNRGFYKLMLENYDEALEDINFSIKQDPKNLYALRNKGIYYVLTDQKELAARYLDEVFDKNPEMELLADYRSQLQ